MKTKFSLIILYLILAVSFNAQNTDSLIVHYYENYPYAYTENGKLKGIEIDIVQEYVSWLKQKKNITLVVTYKPFSEFSAFYNSVKEGRTNVIGLGSVTMSTDRENEVQFSPPYMRNVAVLITAGAVPTIREKTAEQITKVLGSLSAMAVNKSRHIHYLNEIKKQYLPQMNIQTTETQKQVLEGIVNDQTRFGYVDIVAYWSFLKTTPKFLKIQKVFSEPREFLGFAMPKNSKHAGTIGEFFESGFGFTSTKKYQQILESYLGHEIIESVEIK